MSRLARAICPCLLALAGCHAILPLPAASDGPGADAGPADLRRDRSALDLRDGPRPDRSDDLPTGDIQRVWTKASGPNPGRIHAAAAAYHSGRGSVILFGGVDHTDTVSGAMWEYKNGTWTELCDPCGSPGPGPRAGHGLAFDEKRGQLLLYGGVEDNWQNNQPALGDLWIWDNVTANPRKHQSPDGASPGPRVEHYFAHDAARGVTVLFGGRDVQAENDSYNKEDLYEFDGTYWKGPFTPPSRPAPRYSYAHSMTYVPDSPGVDPALRGRVVLCGGATGLNGTYYDDCWTWDGTSWTELCGPGVGSGGCTGTPRIVAPLVFDPLARRLLMMGGYNHAKGELAGTWSSSDGASWIQIDPSLPEQRDTMAAAYCLSDQLVLLHGGNGLSCPAPDGGGAWPLDHNCDETLLYVLKP
jgi:hypothetical protein